LKTQLHQTKKLDIQKTIADNFNNYFASIGLKLAEQIQYNGNNDINTYLEKNINCKFQISTIDEDDIKDIMDSLTTKNSSGFDNLSTFI
jgi:hypothetical protein